MINVPTATARILAQLLLPSLLLAGCATPGALPSAPSAKAIARESREQMIQALAVRHAREYRLARVSVPLLQAALPLCPHQRRYYYGLWLQSLDDYPRNWRPAADRLYDLDGATRLLPPPPESPAAQAGLRSGDRVLRIQGRALDSAMLHRDRLLERLRHSPGPITVELTRNGRPFSVRLRPLELCDWPVRLSGSEQVNAFADGKQIRVTEALLRYAPRDKDLALVIAHEIAHNGLHHVDKQLQNLLVGGLFDVLATVQGYPSMGIGAALGVQRHAVDWEIEADLEAVKLLHRAGDPLDGIAEFWRRLGSDFPQAINHSRGLDHPSTAERYLRMKAAIAALPPPIAPSSAAKMP